jgi:hypothetical protein
MSSELKPRDHLEGYIWGIFGVDAAYCPNKRLASPCTDRDILSVPAPRAAGEGLAMTHHPTLFLTQQRNGWAHAYCDECRWSSHGPPSQVHKAIKKHEEETSHED